MTKVAVIVGAGDAIGSAVGRRFAKGGYTVCLVRRSAEKAAPHIAAIEAADGKAHAFACDACDETALTALFETIERDVGPAEVCLFNAGANTQKSAMETSGKLFQPVWQRACFARFITGREAARHMLPRGRGTILFTGATASLRGGAGFAAFGPRGPHVAHLVIDGGVDSPAIHARRRARVPDAPSPEPGSLTALDTVAETYWTLYTQPRDGWTFEMDIRPSVERW